ncbi:MAG: AAA domain-containing protein [Bacteroidota bacterium]|nr:AAA domain-containing protein [Bacteroidota bacterium]
MALDQLTRLKELVEFAQQTALMRSNPVSDVSKYNIFTEFDYNISSLPGVHVNENDNNDQEYEIWISIDRLHESPAPRSNSEILDVWLENSNNPAIEPKLKPFVQAQSLAEMGALSLNEGGDASVRILTQLDSYEYKDHVFSLYKSFLEIIWRPWAGQEKLKRRTISLYSKLFTLKQQLEGGIIDTQLELVLGMGIASWNMSGLNVNFPLITKLVELTLNDRTMAIEVRPRDKEPIVELAIFSANDNPAVSDLEKFSREFFSQQIESFSPFDPSTFEPLLKTAAALLDPQGIFVTEEMKKNDPLINKREERLKVFNSWVLFARPRGASIFIQDLERFKRKMEEELVILPNALAALVTEPSKENSELKLPLFRGISVLSGESEESAAEKAQDLYFPMPYNDEQVRIVQLLDASDGVVVQGPPGTGKTHTIANIICHYLALGKRVLVTSMKDPALAVLQEKLPQSLRTLAISLLSSEQAGMKQFEHSILKIASEVQKIDRKAWASEVKSLEDSIDDLHLRLKAIDLDIEAWAKCNLSKIELDNELIEPTKAAEEALLLPENNILSEDELTIDKKYTPRFSPSDIDQLKEARKLLSKDIVYLDARLPEIDLFPESREIIRTHLDLINFNEIQSLIENGEIPKLVSSSAETYNEAEGLLEDIYRMKGLRQSIKDSNCSWSSLIFNRLRDSKEDEILEMFVSLGDELESNVQLNKKFLARPITIQTGIELNDEVTLAIGNLSEGKKPFGIAGLFGKGKEKAVIDSIRILNSPPKDSDEWSYVLDHMSHLKNLRGLITRWNAIAGLISLPVYSSEPEESQKALESYTLYKKHVEYIHLEERVISLIKKLIPSWTKVQLLRKDSSILIDAERIFLNHISRNKLSEVWAVKESFQNILSGCNGKITHAIHEFLDNSLGNPDISDIQLQSQWTTLMDELRRINSLRAHFETLKKITGLISSSGAPKWALRLTREAAIQDEEDELLPDNLFDIWRGKRLASYLDQIYGKSDLKKLAAKRSEMEHELSGAYKEIVTKKTWLKLAENATPDVRSALMAYLSAIAKIGKGTGKRAIRYRQDARRAAYKANPAIPCWIMPHYRISESLPAEFGCFDLVVIDEASQSDLTALPAILRAKKILVVGDDKQVSPDGVGLEEEKIRSLMQRFLNNQVETFRPQMTPERSVYDLFKVVFAQSSVMLREHFRCAAPIIEYSKREFYNHEIKPLRIPRPSERLDPSLVDVLLNDGLREGDTNSAEARYIVDQIKLLLKDPKTKDRSIGVVSLLGDKQALKIWEMLEEEIGLEMIQKNRITCGDARTFQGKERDIMFLSMVVSKENAIALTRDSFAQRFNVAASRAKDRMYLVRSIQAEDLSDADKLRRGLISHFSAPFDEGIIVSRTDKQLCSTNLERELFDILTEKGFVVYPQVAAGDFHIDLVVEGAQDRRLAIECDGDRQLGIEKWKDDLRRQRILERAGWHFWCCFASSFIWKREELLDDLFSTLKVNGIEPLKTE